MNLFPLPHTVLHDPGTAWTKDSYPAIDAPPDQSHPPLPQAQWPIDAVRTGVYGAVTPNVVALPDGGFRMYYTQILPRSGHPAGANDYDHATTRILSAVSADGAVWTPETGVRLAPQDGGGGDYRVVSPEVVPVPDSDRLRMYYEACPGTQATASAIRSAVSDDDGLHWTMEPGVRLGYSGRAFNAPRVIFLADGRVRLYCGERGYGIISAVSNDGGLSFTQEEGRRIAPGQTYDALTAFAPEVLRIGRDGYRMYYAGYSAPNRAYVLSAVSDDGLHWEKEAEPVIVPGGRWDGAKCSEMCVAALPGGRYRLFYEACDGTAKDERGIWRIASATASGHT